MVIQLLKIKMQVCHVPLSAARTKSHYPPTMTLKSGYPPYPCSRSAPISVVSPHIPPSHTSPTLTHRETRKVDHKTKELYFKNAELPRFSRFFQNMLCDASRRGFCLFHFSHNLVGESVASENPFFVALSNKLGAIFFPAFLTKGRT